MKKLSGKLGYFVGTVGVWLCNHSDKRPCTKVETKYAFAELKGEFVKQGMKVISESEEKTTVEFPSPGEYHA